MVPPMNIDDNETVDIEITPGATYAVFIAGLFNSGSLAVYHREPTVGLQFADADYPTFTADGGFVFTACTSILRLVMSGSSGPLVVVNLTPCS
jgi:hypothetical protein